MIRMKMNNFVTRVRIREKIISFRRNVSVLWKRVESLTHIRGEQVSENDLTLRCTEPSNMWHTLLLSHFRSRLLVCHLDRLQLGK